MGVGGPIHRFRGLCLAGRPAEWAGLGSLRKPRERIARPGRLNGADCSSEEATCADW